jgi:protein-S-isoprenylcysteine O-methyltransferase Ste14
MQAPQPPQSQPHSRLHIPPVFLLVSLLLMAFLDQVFPGADVIFRPYRYAGVVIIGLGLALIVWAALLFRRAGTNLHPHQPSLALVTGGPYRFTRNPIYLGMAGILLGAAIWMGSLTPFVVIPGFMALVGERFIDPEEAKMQATFGQAYLDYKERVRRWL